MVKIIRLSYFSKSLLTCTFLVLIGFCSAAKAGLPLKRDTVSLQLKWHHQFQFAGYYAAVKKGFYEREGLAVKLLKGEPPKSPIDRVLAGTAQYGIANSDVFQRFLNHEPLVVLAAIYQHSPYILISLRGKEISSPGDLVGKKVLVAKGQGTIVLKSLLLKEGISLNKVQIVDYSYKVDLRRAKIDAIIAYGTDKPFELQKEGFNTHVIDPITYGIDFYGDLLFTTSKEAEEHPDRVEKFKRASLKGWQYAMDHPEEIALYIEQLQGVKERGLTYGTLMNEAQEVRKLIMPDLVELGHINPGRCERIVQNYKELGLVPANATLGNFIYSPANKKDRWPAILALLFGGIMVVILLIISRNKQLSRKVVLQNSELEQQNRIRREAEELAQANQILLDIAVESAGLGVFTWNVYSKEIFFNPQWATMLGYDMAELEPHSKTWLQNIHPDESARIRSEILNFLRSGRDNYKFEHRIRTKTGNWKWVLAFLKVQERNSQNKPTKVTGVHLDIDEVKAKQTELQNLTHELLYSNSELQKFAYITSHNLRAPAVNLLSLSQLFNYDDPCDSFNVEVASKIHKASKQLNDTLNDLIEIVSNKPGAAESTELLDLENETAALLNSIEYLIKTHEARIDTDFSEVPQVHYSRKVLHSVLLNLISNAIKYRSAERQPRIKISTYKRGNQHFMSVQDNGQGIDLERHKNKIFGLYQRFNTVTDGKGLGLFIVKSQIEALNGTISVNSRMDEGTTFTIGFNKFEV